MYAAKSFRENRLSVLQDFIVEHAFATLVSHGLQGIEASHVPLILDRTQGPNGLLLGHFARANPHRQSLADGEVLSVFHGPHAYITPSWCASKRQHGRVVPTWVVTGLREDSPMDTEVADWVERLGERK